MKLGFLCASAIFTKSRHQLSELVHEMSSRFGWDASINACDAIFLGTAKTCPEGFIVLCCRSDVQKEKRKISPVATL